MASDSGAEYAYRCLKIVHTWLGVAVASRSNKPACGVRVFARLRTKKGSCPAMELDSVISSTRLHNKMYSHGS